MTTAAEDKYRFTSFPPGSADGRADAETTGWLEAAALGFHEAAPAPEHLLRSAQVYEADGRVLTGAYAVAHPDRSWETLRPVATYGTFTKPLNVGGGGSLDAHLIATVTVRSNHRRRGLLRELVTSDLATARSQGRAVAILSSMEATIYGRFGFGPATFSRRVEVDTSARFALTHAPAGSVEIADPSTLLDLAPDVFNRFHARTLGSVQRPASYPSKIAGIWAEDEPEPNTGTRAALHYDPAGAIDGYVAYRVLGFDVEPRTITIQDIVWSSQSAYFGLWNYLASIDLVTRVKLGHAAMDDALPWAMVDRRGFNVIGEEDGLWLRVLDPVAALQARTYDAAGDLRICLTDPLSIAGGAYTISVRHGRATVIADTTTNVARTAASGSLSSIDEVSMDISALGSLYLGGVRASVLARTGQITGSPGAIDTLDTLFGHKEQPHCITHF